MKLTNLCKKAATTVLALAVVGLFAACSNGSNNNNSNDNNYKVMYDDILIEDELSEKEFNEGKDVMPEGSYTLTGRTINLNNSGFDFMLNMFSEEDNKEYVAIVAYQKKMVTPITEADLTKATSALKEHDDYEKTHDGRVIEVTESGYKKGAALFGDHQGSGSADADEDDDDEQVMGGFNLMYDDTWLNQHRLPQAPQR